MERGHPCPPEREARTRLSRESKHLSLLRKLCGQGCPRSIYISRFPLIAPLPPVLPFWNSKLSVMAHYLDIATWPRRQVFEFFRGFDKPYFNICTRVDVTRLVEGLRGRGLSVSMAYHYVALRAANEIEPFRYRLRAGKVFVHDVIHGGTTVLLPSEAFTLAYFDYVEDFEKFVIDGARAIAEAHAGDGAFRPRNEDDGRIHFTVVPWFSFTSFSHARNWGTEDSIPKIAFGKFLSENQRVLLPISIEVHHALLDGFTVGRYLTRLEEMLSNPEAVW